MANFPDKARRSEASKKETFKVDKRVIEAYQTFISALSKEEQEIEVAILPYGAFTRRELIKHLEKGDKIGEEAARIFCETTRQELAEKGVVLSTEDALIGQQPKVLERRPKN